MTAQNFEHATSCPNNTLIPKSFERFSSKEFLSAICHELKTPLNAIIGFSDMVNEIIRNPQSTEECVTYIKEINTVAKEMSEIVHDLLDVEHLEGDFSINKSQINIADTLKRAVRLNYDHALRKRINLKVEISDNLKPINLDAKRMKQVLTNLISNAIKYSDCSSEVRINAKTINNILEISVADQGAGMSEEQLKIAFTKYGTIPNKNSYLVDSLGLGLPITKHLVELQNGKIEAKSEIGKGTEMTLQFPY